MKSIPVFLLSLICVLTAARAMADDVKAQNSRGKDAAGFSQQIRGSGSAKLPTYLIEMKDGALLPAELVVPARTKFLLVVRNIGSKPAEFESNQLRQEKVLFMGADTSLVITPLDAGSYDYFDDFAPNVRGKIIARPKD